MELVLLLFLFVLNGFFSMSEMAVVSARKARLLELQDAGHAGSRAALELANQPGHFLSTIQVGITVIGITSGVLGEAALSARVAQWLAGWPALAPTADTIATTLVIAGITVGSLIIGELVPKRLALANPETFASAIARPMQWLSALVYPLVGALSMVTDGILRLLGAGVASSPPVSEREIRALMEQGAAAGVFEEHENQLVSRVFRMDELRATAVMTPRTDIVCLDLNESRERILATIADTPHTKFPVVRGGLDHIEGIIDIKRVLVDLVHGRPLDLESRLEKPLYVPETLTVTEVLRACERDRQTMALIVNEYGELEGLTTLNDVMHAFVGDIGTVLVDGDTEIVMRADGSWLIDGGIGIDRLKQALQIEEALPREDTGVYHTLAGFVIMQLQRVPQTGDRFDWGGLRFEVVDMDRNRVDKLLVARLPEPAI